MAQNAKPCDLSKSRSKAGMGLNNAPVKLKEVDPVERSNRYQKNGNSWKKRIDVQIVHSKEARQREILNFGNVFPESHLAREKGKTTL